MKFKKNIAKGLVSSLFLINIPVNSFANNLNIEQNKYVQELSNIETKEGLQKSAQKAIKGGGFDTWTTGLANMPTARKSLASVAINGKIYCIGGWSNSYTNIVEVYDLATDSWETKTSMPTNRSAFAIEVVDGKIYCIGGQKSGSPSTTNVVEVYDPVTDSWETKTPMPSKRDNLTSVAIDGKIYCIGGYNGSSRLDKVEVYDPATDSWETRTSMPTSRMDFGSAEIDGKIYCIGGATKPSSSAYINNVEVYTARMTPEDEARNAVDNAEQTKDSTDIEYARDLVNKLSESSIKDELQDRLDSIFPNNLQLDLKTITSNVDIYIKSENILSMSLDTNSIAFNEFSGVEDMEKVNAVNISINSSLPYELNAYLPTEIYNTDKSNAMDKSILNIKENSELNYQTFGNTTDKILLKDNCSAGNDLVHGIDLKLKGSISHKKDVYKATIKFEAQQK